MTHSHTHIHTHTQTHTHSHLRILHTGAHLCSSHTAAAPRSSSALAATGPCAPPGSPCLVTHGCLQSTATPSLRLGRLCRRCRWWTCGVVASNGGGKNYGGVEVLEGMWRNERRHRGCCGWICCVCRLGLEGIEDSADGLVAWRAWK